MAEAVEKVLAEGGILLAEAGTGTGKTLAYLVPAVQAGRRVVVSTATRNLQEQIAARDIPFLRDRLGLSFTALTMKGRENYLCLHRYAEFGREPRLSAVEEADPYALVRNWAEGTATGDRAEVPGLPDGVRFWRDINARSDTCLGRRCPDYEDCFLVRMRRQAEESALLIVNHALLFADLAVRRGDFGAVIPDHDILVLDEAHRVEEIATQYFGLRLSSWQIRDLVEDARRLAGRALPEALTPIEGIAEAGGALFAALRESGEGRRRLAEDEPRDLKPLAAVLAASLDRLARVAAVDEGDDGPGAADDREAELAGVREGLRRRCLETAGVIADLLGAREPEWVRWAEVRGGGASLHASPVDVSSLLREHLFSRLHAAVLTSATLAVEGSFDFVRRRLGVPEAEEVNVGSPFDYESQGVLYLPRGLPEPGEAGFIPAAFQVVRQILEISRGRAFLLFTSFEHLQAMRGLLEAETTHPLLVQGDQPRGILLDRFRRAEGSVLLGTSSFWEGVDVPGEALTAVVINRLPFSVPDDPLLAARLEGIRRQGGDPFTDYQVPEAVLALKQGAGRLIRTRSDRGILCILDPRLGKRRYGATFLASLPPFRVTRDLEEVRGFMRRVEEGEAAGG
jgi:ATP-dependent DNA helicase DinG